MSLEGQQLDRYRLLRLLGSGGMGDVYLAEDPRIGQQVAIKVIRAEVSPYPTPQTREKAARLFYREAKAIVKLDHPNILPLFAYGEAALGQATWLYLVMPYRPEGSLAEWLQTSFQGRLLSPSEVAHLVRQAADALQHAHERQIIHQDVKPSNFLLRERPEVPTRPEIFLADFGIARLLTATSSASQSARGTPTYMAPEQYLGEAVPASDQYALAVMAYELLAGQPPFEGNPVHIMYQHLHGAPTPPSARNPSLPQDLDFVLLHALAKNPKERFGSVAAFARAFEQAAESTPVAEVTTLLRPAQDISEHSVEAVDALADTSTRLITPQSDLARLTPPLAALDADPMLSVAASPAEAVPLDVADASTLLRVVPLETEGREAADAPASLAQPPAEPTSAPVGVSALPAPGRVRRPKRKGQAALLALVAVLLLALGMGSAAAMVTGSLQLNAGGPLAPGSEGQPDSTATQEAATATVTITPASENVQSTFTIAAVTGTPDAAQQQVGARVISVTTQSYAQTVNATGQGSSPGTHATGIATFTSQNASPVSFSAGSSFGNNQGCYPVNVSLVIDAPVTVYISNPIVSVPAHINEIGSVGNLPGPCAGGTAQFEFHQHADLYTVIANNFSGGTDAQTYAVVQQGDIDGAANSLISANQPDAHQVIQSQLQPDEQLIGTQQCSPDVSANHRAGDAASQVTVTVSFTCTGEAYDHDGALALGATLLRHQAATTPGADYTLVGQIKTNLVSANPDNQGEGAIVVSAEGIWVYQFSDAQKQALSQLIAGKSTQEAQQVLSTQAGVAQASIKLTGGRGQTLPSDLANITIIVQTVSGL